jgi:hypothetical protein
MGIGNVRRGLSGLEDGAFFATSRFCNASGQNPIQSA